MDGTITITYYDSDGTTELGTAEVDYAEMQAMFEGAVQDAVTTAIYERWPEPVDEEGVEQPPSEVEQLVVLNTIGVLIVLGIFACFGAIVIRTLLKSFEK